MKGYWPAQAFICDDVVAIVRHIYINNYVQKIHNYKDTLVAILLLLNDVTNESKRHATSV